jgi:hypothetical protein
MSFQKHLMVRLAVDSLSAPRPEKARGSIDTHPPTANRDAQLLSIRRLFQRFWRLCTGKRNQIDLAGKQAATLLPE